MAIIDQLIKNVLYKYWWLVPDAKYDQIRIGPDSGNMQKKTGRNAINFTVLCKKGGAGSEFRQILIQLIERFIRCTDVPTQRFPHLI
jgi:hypothetical protein